MTTIECRVNYKPSQNTSIDLSAVIEENGKKKMIDLLSASKLPAYLSYLEGREINEVEFIKLAFDINQIPQSFDEIFVIASMHQAAGRRCTFAQLRWMELQITQNGEQIFKERISLEKGKSQKVITILKKDKAGNWLAKAFSPVEKMAEVEEFAKKNMQQD